METESAEITIDRPVADVWPLVAFDGIGWMPGVDSLAVDGDTRVVSMGGSDITERLVDLDEAGHRISYSIVDGPMPLDGHLCVVAVDPEGDGSKVTWTVSAEAPAGAAGFLRDIYAGALAALKAEAEAGSA